MRVRLAPSALKNKRSIYAFILILVILVILVVWHSLSGPAVGSVDNSSNLQMASAPAASSALITFHGTSLSFSYPASYQKRVTQPQSGPILENYDFTSGGYPAADLAVAVYSLSSDNLQDSPAYLLRKEKPAQYSLETWQAGKQSVPVYSDSSVGYSKVAFMVHSGKLATIALSGGSDPTADETQQKAVINSVRWND